MAILTSTSEVDVAGTPATPACHPAADSSTRCAAARASVVTSHSHTRTTVQPIRSAVVVASASLSRTRSILLAHRAAFGPVNGLLRPCTGQECHQHPSTNTASLRPGKTMSGVHIGPSWRWTRKRAPAACNACRRRISGRVSTRRRPARWRPSRVDTHCSLGTGLIMPGREPARHSAPRHELDEEPVGAEPRRGLDRS